MKKLTALLLAILTVVSCSAFAFADNTTTLTTTVPDASYTLNIPADQTIPYGETIVSIGECSVTNAKNFGAYKNLNVTLSYDAFASETTDTTIPYQIRKHYKGQVNTSKPVQDYYEQVGDGLVFQGQTGGSISESFVINSSYAQESTGKELCLYISDAAVWEKANSGTYTSVITFTAQVVSTN